MQAVIDTSVASMMHRGQNGSGMDPFYATQLAGKIIAISFQTVEEMLFGACRDGWGAARVTALEAFLRRFLVVPGSYDLAVISARLRTEAQKGGRRLETADAWIMATAMQLGVPLITDDKDQALAGIAGYSFQSRHAAFVLPTVPSGAAVGVP